jgi:hypothetical protein
VSNGLGSPSCRRGAAGELSSTEEHNCETSGFVAAGSPTGNYGIDVHIDAGVLNSISDWISSAIQDIVVSSIWMGLVWSVHALVVMLEWCFTIDLLPSEAAGSLGAGLRGTEASFTQPWLALALAVASVIAVYQGLIRRRVAQTVGEAVLTVAMMAGALWVIADPTGTLGSLGEWANQAALGTLAVAAQGSPSHPEQAFAGSLGDVFATTIEGPWCYLEFGDVDWCREPARLDSRLRDAALKLATAELGEIGCDSNQLSSVSCVVGGSRSAKAIEDSAEMLRGARSNGAIFLAFPPNGPARNSINEEGSLLRAICQSASTTSCHGSAAAQAQFRTAGQTWSRLAGLLLILTGLLGMLLLLGFLGLRLLTAALFGLLYLLAAPAMVLAPAFGEGGRALFRRWAMQLLETVVAKLLFSFLLGIVLALLGTVSSLTALGWWTQWLLMSALWWGAYLRRHQALGVASGAVGAEGVQRTPGMRRALEAGGRIAMAEWRTRRKKQTPEAGPPPSTHPQEGGSPPAERQKPPVDRIPSEPREGGRDQTHESSEGESARERAPERQPKPGRSRLTQETAEAEGEGRREAEQETGGRGGEGRVQQADQQSGSSLDPPEESGEVRRRPAAEGRSSGESGPGERPGQAPKTPGGSVEPTKHPSPAEARDYGELAGLAGYTRAEFERLEPRRREQARLTIEREIREREDPPEAGGELPRRERGTESSVMRDIREVEAGRKRQLGLDRP